MQQENKKGNTTEHTLTKLDIADTVWYQKVGLVLSVKYEITVVSVLV